MAAAQTRLDRLVTLLDAGSTPTIKGTAARQLGQIAALRVRGGPTSEQSHTERSSVSFEPKDEDEKVKHEESFFSETSSPSSSTVEGSSSKVRAAGPSANVAKSQYVGVEGDWNQAIFLLARVLPHLRSKAWDTRVAAAQAIEAICASAGTWDPDQGVEENRVHVKKEEEDISADHNSLSNPPAATALPTDLVNFSTFSLPHVLVTGKKLLSSAGNEYDLPAFTSVEDRLAHAKRDMQRLGLGGLAGEDLDLGMDVEKELLADAENGNSSVDKRSGSSSGFDIRLSNPPKTPGSLPPPRFAPQGPGSSLPPPRFGTSASGFGNDTESKALPGSVESAESPHNRSGSSKSPVMGPPELTPSVQVAAPPSSTSTPSEEGDLSKLSARERNQLKRKRKMEEKGVTGGGGEVNKARAVESSSVADGSGALRVKTAPWTNNVPSPDPQKGPNTPYTPTTPSAGQGQDYLTAGSGSGNGTQTPLTPRGSVDGSAVAAAAAANATSLVAPLGQWPFSLVSSLLLGDLFSPKWEIRHGAALGLRELFKIQGAGGGKVVKHLEQESYIPSNSDCHTAWCEDAAIRLLCVLSLDRLGDFVFDHVVAPVRETVGQTLASLLKWMHTSSVSKVHACLLEMVRQDFTVGVQDLGTNDGKGRELQARRGCKGYAWEVRHAGLLGLKYEVSVRRDILVKTLESGDFVNDSSLDFNQLQSGVSPSHILLEVIDVAILCLKDDDDDVRGVAAATLLPITDLLLQHVPDSIGELLGQLWNCLHDLKDDLSSSTGGVMDLLANLIEKPRAIAHLNLKVEDDKERLNLSELVPRLFPFFRHTITSVRLSVLNALTVFLSVPTLPRDWVDARVLRLLFQNLIVEERMPIREASRIAWTKALAIVLDVGGTERLLKLVGPYLPSFFKILMTPLGSPIDYSLFYKASSGVASREAHDVDKGVLAQDLALVGVDTVIRGRLGAAEALGRILVYWARNGDEKSYELLLAEYISSSSALQKCLASAVIQEWAESSWEVGYDLLQDSAVARTLAGRLISILESPPPTTYAEMAFMLQRIQNGCQSLYNAFGRDAKVPKNKIPSLSTSVDPLGQSSDAFTVETAKEVVGKLFDGLVTQIGPKLKKTMLPSLQDRQRKIIAEVGFYQSMKSKQDTQISASAAAAIIAIKSMPSKLNPVIRSIMSSVKFEENVDLQLRSARAVASFIDYCCSPAASANPSDKILKNLCAFVCQDTSQTPIFANVKDQEEGIFSMNEVPAAANKVKAGQPDLSEPESVREGRLIRRGAEMTLKEIAQRFGDRLFETLPTLWDCMSSPLLRKFGNSNSKDIGESEGQEVVDSCTLIQVDISNLDECLHKRVAELLPALTLAVQSKYAVIRSVAAKCLSSLADCMTEETMIHVVNAIVPLLGDASSVVNRQGAIETISQIVMALDINLLPYVVVLVVPILGRMSDTDDAVRLVATNTFASLVKMVPLEAGLPDPPGFSQELLVKRQEERKFLSQLLDGAKVEPYTIPVKINAELRKYQQDGVNWMAFLAKFQLHGVLCDDMGLGKTLQSICILSSKHYERAQRFEQTKSSDSAKLPSLVVCPPTLTGHWCHEIRQYSQNLRPLLYSGLPTERTRLQSQIPTYDAVVMSYDTVRNDIASLSQISWLYCILDEGHVIKSAKTKTTKAIKMIKSQHRLILSGTPIQNNVLELWSLFDFLMPGFLGTERTFHERFGKPILASRDGKVTAKEHEKASLALDALHKQVLPFLLRRMKEDVLNDLPPKIIQDIECDLGDVQRKLYDEFSRNQDRDAIEGAFEGETAASGDPSKKHHVFQTLQYLRKLVNHPLLVFDKANKKHIEVEQHLVKSGSSLRDISNAPKLLALRQLLNDCGISGNAITEGPNTDMFAGAAGAGSAVSQHRVLIFCQLKQMLDIIESDLFKTHMPSVTYMRLDGGVTAEKRHGIVQRFNSDPSIDVLLLTTQVGGLGLTLTGADTVIFVEHDWNPMKDLQAMDRAHRLGQKKVVNVYRLITRNTLEAKIMGLQRFKLNVANSVVTQQNASLESMETDQILDLFDPSAEAKDGDDKLKERKSAKGGISQKALLASLDGLPDTGDDYERMNDWEA